MSTPSPGMVVRSALEIEVAALRLDVAALRADLQALRTETRDAVRHSLVMR